MSERSHFVFSVFFSPNALSIARGDLFGKREKEQEDDMGAMTHEGAAAQKEEQSKQLGLAVGTDPLDSQTPEGHARALELAARYGKSCLGRGVRGYDTLRPRAANTPRHPRPSCDPFPRG